MRAQREGGRSRGAVKVYESVIPVVLFALAFGGALLALREPGAGVADPAQALAPERGGAGVLSGLSAGSEARSLSRGPAAEAPWAAGARGAIRAQGAASADATPADTRAGAMPERGPARGPRAISEVGVARASSEVLVAGTLSGAAPEAPLTNEPVVDAVSTLDNSLSPDDRARAINSLAASTPEGPDVARARSSLRVAATDEDPDIAARAQEAYDLLVERDDR